jgi:septum formation protein
VATIPDLVLASGSPRRRELLEGLGLRFKVRPVDLDESPLPGESPRDYVLRLATEKAAARVEEGELVLAADTTVVVDGEILGKPLDEDGARRMLRLLAGREHAVLTGIALHGSSGKAAEVDETLVRFAPLSEAEIDWYVATGEPRDKAGAYAIQGLGSLFVEGVVGSWSNVVGLPLPRTYRLFARLGYDLKAFRKPRA